VLFLTGRNLSHSVTLSCSLLGSQLACCLTGDFHSLLASVVKTAVYVCLDQHTRHDVTALYVTVHQQQDLQSYQRMTVVAIFFFFFIFIIMAI
jgi:hypothetical protein